MRYSHTPTLAARVATILATATVLAVALPFIPATAEISSERSDMIALQTRLARAHASPGPIDGYMGKNTELAIKAYQRMHGLDETGEPSDALRQRLSDADTAPVLTDYEITQDDVDGPFVDKMPSQFKALSKLDRLSYKNPHELLAEKFHMDRELLRELNPDVQFDEAGQVIKVTNVRDIVLGKDVASIDVIKSRQSVWAYDDAGNLIASYPSTIGSDDTPSPTGEHEVKGVAFDPTYTYDPDQLDFEGVSTDEVFKIAPGPNNPVGTVWIDLDAPGYGIHGSPEPEQIRREASHGCVRLTNWDARQLGEATSPGVMVHFVDEPREPDSRASDQAASTETK